MAGHRSCSFYRLCPLLLQEAQLMETRVSSDNLCKDVIRTTSATQRKLEETWDDVGEISTGHSFACVVPFTCPATECVQIAIDAIFLWFLCVEQLVMCIVSLMMTLFCLRFIPGFFLVYKNLRKTQQHGCSTSGVLCCYNCDCFMCSHGVRICYLCVFCILYMLNLLSKSFLNNSL